MTTRTKITICSYTATIMMLLIVFSKPLNIPELFHRVMIVGVLIPLALMFHFIKAQKKEQAEESTPETPLSASSNELVQKKKKNQIILMIVAGTAVGLSCPLWLPLTGSSLGAQGDLFAGLITAVIVLAILGPQLRKLQRN
jgi:hypothetical protein